LLERAISIYIYTHLLNVTPFAIARAQVKPAFASVVPATEVARAQAACSACGGTGVAAALSRAAALCADTLALALPVGDAATLQALGFEGMGAPSAPLRDCLLVGQRESAAVGDVCL
jgi:hypothetical protein